MTGFKSKKQAAMGKREMTPWFPVTINPVHIGVYPVKINGLLKEKLYSKWDGKKWCYVAESLKLARRQTRKSFEMYYGNEQVWRGFTNEQ